MKKKLFPSVLLFVLPVVVLAEVPPHIGYVYPAGARPGGSVTIQIGGQYIKQFDHVALTSGSLEGELLEYSYEVDRRQAGRARRLTERIKAAMEEEEDDTTREQMQFQMDQLAGEMQMAKMMRQEQRKNPELAKKKQFNPQLAEQLEVRLTLPADLPPGTTELRLIATNGISNPLIFDIGGTLNEVLETEPNSTLEEANALDTFPLVLNGQMMPGDVDCFRFHAEEGQTLVFRVHARSLVPYLADAVPGWFQAVLTLYDGQGRELACRDDYRFDPDPVLIFDVPETGSYLLRLNDSIYRGRRDFVYRIEMGELPFIESIFPLGGPDDQETTVVIEGVNLPRTRKVMGPARHADVAEIRLESNGLFSNTRVFQFDELPEQREAEPNSRPGEAQAVAAPVIINGQIGTPGDVDCFSFEGREGDELSLEIMARRLGSPLDARLILLGPDGNIVTVGDDLPDRSYGLVTHHADACMVTELPATGRYTVRMDDLQVKGGAAYAYRLRIGPVRPDFCLRITPAGLRLPRDGSAVATVHAVRKNGFDGPIELELVDAPEGIEMETAVIPAGENTAAVNLLADDDLEFDTCTLQIEGEGRDGLYRITRRAVAAEDQMQAFLWRHLVPADELMVLITDPEPVAVTLDLPRGGIVEAHPGSEISFPADISYHGDEKGIIRLALSEPPEWLTLNTKGIGGPRAQDIKFSISSNAEVGDVATLLLTGMFRRKIPEEDPRYNPVLKWTNVKTVEFPIAAVPVKIVD